MSWSKLNDYLKTYVLFFIIALESYFFYSVYLLWKESSIDHFLFFLVNAPFGFIGNYFGLSKSVSRLTAQRVLPYFYVYFFGIAWFGLASFTQGKLHPLFWATLAYPGIVYLYVFWTTAFNRPDNSDVLAVGRVFPDAQLVKVDGTTVQLKDLMVGPSLLLFFRGWCPYCRSNMKEISAAYREIEARGVSTFFISMLDSTQNLNLSKKLGIHDNLPVTFLSDPNGKFGKLLNIYKENMTSKLATAMGDPAPGSDDYFPALVITDEDRKIAFLSQTDSQRLRPDPEVFLELFDRYQVTLRLEKKVEEKTQGLLKETRKVANLLNNMTEAVFQIDRKGEVIPPVSAYCQTLFDMDIVGKSIFEFLFSDLDPNSGAGSALRSSLDICFGESELQWELVKDNLPRHIKLEISQRILQIKYVPIWDEFQSIQNLMLVVEDVTELERLQENLQKERLEKEKSIQVIEALVDKDSEGVKQFISSALTLVNEIASAVSQSVQSADWQTVLRNAHTLKGNARVFGFSLLGTMAHELENSLIEIAKLCKQKTAVTGESLNKAQGELDSLRSEIERHQKIASRVFHWNSNQSERITVEVAKASLARLKETLLASSQALGKIQDFSRIDQAVRRLEDVPMKPYLSRLAPMISEIASRLGKEVHYEVLGDELTLDRQKSEMMNDVLMHLIRNSLDHGIETPDQRNKAGKPRAGKVSVRCEDSLSSCKIQVTDDGQGIDGERIAQIAIKKGLLDELSAKKLSIEEKIQLIFLPQFSTKETVSDVSGRGVGTDVAKANVERLGGAIKVLTQVGKGTSFEISIPL